MWPCERLDEIDSTQRELQRRLAHVAHAPGQPQEPFAVWTTCQTNGIASHGRRWQDASRGLAFSVAWPEALCGNVKAAWPVRISLMAASTLEACFPQLARRLGVKWPNDVMCGSEKLAGILVSRHASSAGAWLIAGVGINLRWEGAHPFDRPVTSLAALGVSECDEQLLVQALCQSISQLWADVRDDANWRHEFERRDVHYQRPVSVVDPASGRLLHQGIAQGISDAGELMLRVGEKLHAIQIGEVSVRMPDSHHKDGQRDEIGAKAWMR